MAKTCRYWRAEGPFCGAGPGTSPAGRKGWEASATSGGRSGEVLRAGSQFRALAESAGLALPREMHHHRQVTLLFCSRGWDPERAIPPPEGEEPAAVSGVSEGPAALCPALRVSAAASPGCWLSLAGAKNLPTEPAH